MNEPDKQDGLQWYRPGENFEPIPCTAEEACKYLDGEDNKKRRVAWDDIVDTQVVPHVVTYVVTSFMPLDYNFFGEGPRLHFETYSPELDVYMRAATIEEARDCHTEAVELVKATLLRNN